MHEDYDYYMDCKYRDRNKGLFTADQVMYRDECCFYLHLIIVLLICLKGRLGILSCITLREIPVRRRSRNF